MRHTVVTSSSRVNHTESDPQPIAIAFEPFYREHYAPVVGLVYALTGSRAGAEDIAQETFLRAHRNWDEVGRYERPGGWVRVVATNLARSGLRRMGAEIRALSRFAGMNTAVFPELEPVNEAFWGAVRTLPRRQREVTALHYLEDMSVADVAAVLGISESSVKNSLSQARAALVRKLEVEL